MKPIIWSFGGGTQSAAIAVLIALSKLPIPERCVIADTSYESTETWDYTDKFIRPMLSKVGLEVEIATHSLSRYDLYDKKGGAVIPMWTRTGQLSNFCSGNWKRDVVKKWLAQPERGYGRKNPVVQWIGFSSNEKLRCKPAQVKWIENKFPLIHGYGVTLNRADCVRLVENHGLPTPPKSACYFCPFRNQREWKHQKMNYPDDHAKAVFYDNEIRKNDPLQEGLWVHRSLKPLDEVDFDAPEQPVLFKPEEIVCTSGSGCWT